MFGRTSMMFMLTYHMTHHACEFATSHSTSPTSVLVLNVNIVIPISRTAAQTIAKDIF
jgi:3-methyladenine DNA glycosylase Mpg